jgi:endonuclease YncB( thermonuclease family)
MWQIFPGKVSASLILALFLIPASVSAATLTGRVVRVSDGDTIVVLDANNAQHKIRLQGIDAPERGQAYGSKSKDHLSDSVAGKFVVVEYVTRDRYERILGKVLLSGEDMNLGQINAGLAWHYKKYEGEQGASDRIRYSDAELDARRHKRGLWADSDPVPPWDYRKTERERAKSMEAFTIKSETRDKPY